MYPDSFRSISPRGLARGGGGYSYFGTQSDNDRVFAHALRTGDIQPPILLHRVTRWPRQWQSCAPAPGPTRLSDVHIPLACARGPIPRPLFVNLHPVPSVTVLFGGGHKSGPVLRHMKCGKARPGAWTTEVPRVHRMLPWPASFRQPPQAAT